ncbi:hypothetical protein [uncultured Pseudokineococcus sp.]|uniref:hypothetical protein n=1 Tax=uncultured Pseudokineococcus sp. TaxID=1642928 RepID=UPI002608B98F|nr:hypothetical protein [uncultured Pseudokineococcus sp.]
MTPSLDDAVAHLPPDERYARASALRRMVTGRLAAAEAREASRPGRQPGYAKRCLSCGETKLAAEYRSNRTRADGLSSSCRPCMSATDRARREAARVTRSAA